MHDRDCLRRFLFERYPIRGQLVHLDAAWRALIEHHAYPDSVRDLLGEAVAATALLAGTIKFEGLLSLQVQGPGSVHLLLAQCTDTLGVRGLARHRDEIDAAGVAGLVGAGQLSVTLESEDRSRRYQGVVPVEGGRLADTLQRYFENSEQLSTRLWLHADARGASGMLLQKLPAEARRTSAADEEIEDAWRRVQLIGETLTAEELATLADTEILRRLFHEDDLRLFEAAPVYFRCRCSRERVSGMLHALGEEETRAVLAERGSVEVRCDFCDRAYQFDAIDVGEIFQGTASGGRSLH